MKKERKNVKVADILLNEGQVEWLPKNPRQWTQEDLDRTKKSLEEDADFLEDRPILLIEHDGKYLAFAGNLRTSAAKGLGLKNVPCVIYTDEEDADRETIKRRAMKDNGSFGSWDFDTLANEWSDMPLTDWGVPAWDTEEEEGDNEDTDNNYSRKIEVPIYEPTGEDVPISACVDTSKYDELISRIDKANIPADIRDFLKLSATRHIMFTYDRIADYYSNATKEVQELMEESALVFIDYDKAIENGYVEMSSILREQYGIDNPNGENEYED